MSLSKVRVLGAITQFLALSSLCNGYPTLLNGLKARQVEEIGESYDYIIVGGGQSGIVIANRLSADSSKTVLVVEYGYFDNNPAQIEPSSAGNWPARDMFNLSSVPQTGLGGATGAVFAASVVGGGSTVNGMMLNRGSPEDYDNWGKLDNPGWNWDELLPYFKKVREQHSTFHPPSEELAKEFNITWNMDAFGDGPIQESYADYQWPGQSKLSETIFPRLFWSQALIFSSEIQWDAMVEAGAVPQEEGSLNAYGVFWIPAAIDPVTVTRSYAVSGYYDPVKDRENLQIATGTRVNEVLLDEDKRAIGVTVQARGTPDGEDVKTVSATTEIILCSGWLHTPQILQRSGIGPAALLESAGIEVLVDLPGVGSNLQDHPSASANFRYTTDVSPNPAWMFSNQTFRDWAQELWDTERSGPMARTVGNAGGMIPLSVVTPDYEDIIARIQEQENVAEFLPTSYTEESVKGYQAQQDIILESFASPEAAVLELPFSGSGGVSLVLHKPLSRGTVLLNTTNVYAEPLVDYGALMHPGDPLVVANNYRFARKWMATESAQLLGPEEVTPGANKTTDEDLIETAKGGMTPTIGHGCCTSPMQPQELGGVVASDLTVHGVTGLSVGDISIMPLIVASHTCTTVYMIAEKAADLILARQAEE
ncbi:hypothetical protein FQN53_004486 [Emmonsiellopsis sp. PD_33]|nr:hypothetical protein FQN53_004486 [Emmonsiellopsis sp. PD_33]